MRTSWLYLNLADGITGRKLMEGRARGETEAKEIPESRTVNYCGSSQVLKSTTLESSESNVLNGTTTLYKVLPLTSAVRTLLLSGKPHSKHAQTSTNMNKER